MFPSEASASGHLEAIQHLNARIGEAGEARFWFHALRHSFASDGLLVDEGLPMTGKLLGHHDVSEEPSRDAPFNDYETIR